ncbi:MAG: O-antigen ligase family protein [Pseudomonadota bacterium]
MSTLNNQTRYSLQQDAILAPHRASPLMEIVLVATPFLAILFQIVIGSLTPILVIATCGAFILLRWERLYSIFANCWPLFLLPAYALLSVFWSDDPAATLRYGTLYLATVLAAVFLGAGIEKLNFLKGIFIAFAIYMVFALLFGRYGYVFGRGAAFVGLLGSKNAAGDVGALTFLTATIMLIWSIANRQMVWAGLAVVVMAMGAYSLVASLATGALIATIVAFPCMLAWVASRQFDLRIRTSIFILAVVTLVALLATLDFWLEPLFDLVLENSGKDKGLTGRDVLWAKADELIAARPWLGQGYRSFWVHNNLDAEFLWRYMEIASRKGFNFHHTPREILVALGYTGFALFCVVTFYGVFKLLTKTMQNPSYTGIYCCTIMIFESPRIFFEVLGFSDMHFATVILFMVFAFGMRPETMAAFHNTGARR